MNDVYFLSRPKALRRSTCKHGHEWTDENTFLNPRGIKECRLCARERKAAYKKRLKDARPPRVKKPTHGMVSCVDCGAERYIKLPGRPRCNSCARKRVFDERGRLYPLVTCNCGTVFSPHSAGRVHCSEDCRRADGWHANGLRDRLHDRHGEKNPNFKHGKSTGLNLRKFTLKLKGEEWCRNCGSTERLHLHHMIPRKKYVAGREELLNGMALCSRCHLGWHLHGKVIYRDLIREDEWAWLSSVELTGENTLDWLDRHYPPRRYYVNAV